MEGDQRVELHCYNKTLSIPTVHSLKTNKQKK